MIKYVVATTCYVIFFNSYANALSCRGFAHEVRSAIRSHVAALQRIEHEASDRLKGLDSRPFDFIAAEARRVEAIIADPAALQDEAALQRCRNATQPIRKLCADAARLLVGILEQHAAAARPNYDKPPYATLMAECEQKMGLQPLRSAIRGTD